MKPVIMSFAMSIAAAVSLVASTSARAETQKIQLDVFEINGVKVWYPPVVHVFKGDTVEITATSHVPGPNAPHGLMIKEFKTLETVDQAGKTIRFVADKAGHFSIGCHLHPTHRPAMLIVDEQK